MYIGDMNISRLMFYIHQVEKEKLRDKEEFKNKRAKTRNKSGQHKSNTNWSSFEHKQKGYALSSASSPAPMNKCEYNSHNFKAKPTYYQGSMVQGSSNPLAYTKSGRNQLSICREGSTGCFKCVQNVHLTGECPKNKQVNGNGGNRAHSSSVAPPDNTTPIGVTSNNAGGSNHLYDINSIQD